MHDKPTIPLAASSNSCYTPAPRTNHAPRRPKGCVYVCAGDRQPRSRARVLVCVCVDSKYERPSVALYGISYGTADHRSQPTDDDRDRDRDRVAVDLMHVRSSNAATSDSWSPLRIFFAGTGTFTHDERAKALLKRPFVTGSTDLGAVEGLRRTRRGAAALRRPLLVSVLVLLPIPIPVSGPITLLL
ncbi:hypothetical protein EVAR_4354_1 [Eumeta japonica]|uniref:Uncharacterized protein n=1 Tax=Eumeta variegata TaxID=151549 RepID=A0A4C1VC59_EUMVA|nr:hypothetical protein EVAR_4354_1 [Eumeta japonica]